MYECEKEFSRKKRNSMRQRQHPQRHEETAHHFPCDLVGIVRKHNGRQGWPG